MTKNICHKCDYLANSKEELIKHRNNCRVTLNLPKDKDRLIRILEEQLDECENWEIKKKQKVQEWLNNAKNGKPDSFNILNAKTTHACNDCEQICKWTNDFGDEYFDPDHKCQRGPQLPDMKETIKCEGGCGKEKLKSFIDEKGIIRTKLNYLCEECSTRIANEPSGEHCKKCKKEFTKYELKVMYGRSENFNNADFLCETCFANKDQERERERERERETNHHYLTSMTRNPLTKVKNPIPMNSVNNVVLLA